MMQFFGVNTPSGTLWGSAFQSEMGYGGPRSDLCTFDPADPDIAKLEADIKTWPTKYMLHFIKMMHEIIVVDPTPRIRRKRGGLKEWGSSVYSVHGSKIVFAPSTCIFTDYSVSTVTGNHHGVRVRQMKKIQIHFRVRCTFCARLSRRESPRGSRGQVDGNHAFCDVDAKGVAAASSPETLKEKLAANPLLGPGGLASPRHPLYFDIVEGGRSIVTICMVSIEQSF